MAIYSNTRIELRHLTSRLCNDLLLGTAADPGSGTFVCDVWEKSDDYFNDWIEMFCYHGTGSGTSGNPTDWVNTNHTLTFKPAATLTAGDLVEMHQRFTVSEYNDFINLAIDMVAREALINKVDVSIELATDTYGYDLPAQFLWIKRVELESATSGIYDEDRPIDRRYWRVIKGATQQIEFVKEYWSPTDGRKIRIIGFASPSKLGLDTEECPINPIYVVQQAAALLHQSRIRGDDVDSEYHRAQMVLCQTMADRERDKLRISLGGAVPVIEV